MSDIYKDISKKITKLRADYGAKGLTQEELASKIGTKANTVSRWESGVYKPSAGDLHKLANFFGVSISIFFPDKQWSSQHQALLSATSDLGEKDMADLIEYANFRRARAILENERKPRKKGSTKQ